MPYYHPVTTTIVSEVHDVCGGSGGGGRDVVVVQVE